MAIVLDRNSKGSEFELSLDYYVHFWVNTLWKSINPIIPQLLFK